MNRELPIMTSRLPMQCMKQMACIRNTMYVVVQEFYIVKGGGAHAPVCERVQ